MPKAQISEFKKIIKKAQISIQVEHTQQLLLFTLHQLNLCNMFPLLKMFPIMPDLVNDQLPLVLKSQLLSFQSDQFKA